MTGGTIQRQLRLLSKGIALQPLASLARFKEGSAGKVRNSLLVLPEWVVGAGLLYKVDGLAQIFFQRRIFQKRRRLQAGIVDILLKVARDVGIAKPLRIRPKELLDAAIFEVCWLQMFGTGAINDNDAEVREQFHEREPPRARQRVFLRAGAGRGQCWRGGRGDQWKQWAVAADRGSIADAGAVSLAFAVPHRAVPAALVPASPALDRVEALARAAASSASLC